MLSISPPQSRLALQWDYSDEDGESDFAIVCPPFRKESVQTHHNRLQENAIYNEKLNVHCLTPETKQELCEILGYPIICGSETENLCGSDIEKEKPKMAQVLRRYKDKTNGEVKINQRMSLSTSSKKLPGPQKTRDSVLLEMAAKSTKTSAKAGKKKPKPSSTRGNVTSFPSISTYNESYSTKVLPMSKSPNEVWIQVPRKSGNKSNHKMAELLPKVSELPQTKATNSEEINSLSITPEKLPQKVKKGKPVKLPGPAKVCGSRYVPRTTITNNEVALESPHIPSYRLPSIANLLETATIVSLLYIAFSPVF